MKKMFEKLAQLEADIEKATKEIENYLVSKYDLTAVYEWSRYGLEISDNLAYCQFDITKPQIKYEVQYDCPKNVPYFKLTDLGNEIQKDVMSLKAIVSDIFENPDELKAMLEKRVMLKAEINDLEYDIFDHITHSYDVFGVYVFGSDNLRVHRGIAYCNFYISQGRDECQIEYHCPTNITDPYDVIALADEIRTDTDHLNKALDQIFEDLGR